MKLKILCTLLHVGGVPITLQFMFTYQNFEFKTKKIVQITLHNFSLEFVFLKKKLEFLDIFCNSCINSFIYMLCINNHINFISYLNFLKV
jgi:hypothetical protein